MKMNLTILTTLFLLTSVNYLVAQPSVSFYFTTAFPVNDYRLLDSEEGYGGNLEIFFISPSKAKALGNGNQLFILWTGTLLL